VLTNRHAQHIFTTTPRPSSPTTIRVGTLLLMARSHYARLRLKSLRVQEYFDSVKFADITDLDPPHVEVSSDGTMAWLLGHVRVRGTQCEAKGTEVPLAFDAAWIDVWQKQAGGWRIVARATTEKDNAPHH
jgi:hypothetical protein